MLVGDLIYNDDFDCNCNYEVYDCTPKDRTWREAGCIWSTKVNGWHKPLDHILDMKITYITTNDNVIIIEATR